MTRPSRSSGPSWVLALGFVVAGAAWPIAQQQQQRGAFRSQVTLVPVNVRVLDARGNPVTDLTQDDFRVFDRDAPQTIQHFSTQAFTAAGPGAAIVPRLRSAAGLETEPVTYRTFLIVLGRGRLQGPSDGLNAVLDLVRDDLLPQDQIGVVAYNRAFGMTTDHDAVLRLLGSFCARHEEIEARLDHWFSGLQLRFGSKEVPPGVQSLIDTMFDDADVPAVRDLALGTAPGEDEFEAERRRLANSLDPDTDPDEFSPREGYDDLRNLFAGVEFLRYLEGEKHIIFLSEHGLSLPGRRSAEPGGALYGVEAQQRYDDFAALAADARVTISPVQTGGLQARFAGNTYLGPSFGRLHANRDNRALADRTGGLASLYRPGDDAMSRLDRATRFQYLLAYSPAELEWDGAFRDIRVEVARPGVTVHYRRGYFADEELVPYDRRTFFAYTRIMAAGGDRRTISDLGITLDEPSITGDADAPHVAVTLRVSPERLALLSQNGNYVGALHIALFLGDRDGALIGEHWDTLDVTLTDAARARILREGLPHALSADARARVRYVRVVVYDYLGDRLGTAEWER